jgi:hypothetical protein
MFGYWEKRSRLRQIAGMLILNSRTAGRLRVLVACYRRTPGQRAVRSLRCRCIAAFPFILLLLAFAAFVLEGFEVASSLWRTRVGSQE